MSTISEIQPHKRLTRKLDTDLAIADVVNGGVRGRVGCAHTQLHPRRQALLQQMQRYYRPRTRRKRMQAQITAGAENSLIRPEDQVAVHGGKQLGEDARQ